MPCQHRDGQSPSVTVGLTKEKVKPCLESGHWLPMQESIYHTVPGAHASRPCSEITSSRRSAMLSPPLAVLLTSTSVFCSRVGATWRLELCPGHLQPPLQHLEQAGIRNEIRNGTGWGAFNKNSWVLFDVSPWPFIT